MYPMLMSTDSWKINHFELTNSQRQACIRVHNGSLPHSDTDMNENIAVLIHLSNPNGLIQQED